MKPVVATALVAVVSTYLVVAGGCTSNDPPLESDQSAPIQQETPVLQPVSLPDLSYKTESETVRDQLRQQYAALMTTIDDPGATTFARGRAYGDMGKLFMATEYVNEADVSFRNAQALDPRNQHWSYYLGHVYRTKGEPGQAAEFFEQARQLQPGDVPTLVWLAEMHLENGEPGAARPLLEHALLLRPDSLAAQFGLGRVALARKDYFSAVQRLEEARALNPAATAIYTALASAYRSLGQLDRAEVNLRHWRSAERAAADVDARVIIRPADPLMEDVEGLVQSAAAYELRGARAISRGAYAEAAAQFRSGLELQPDNPSLRHKLGTMLALMGNTRGSQDQFEQIVRQSPGFARAHYSLGVLMEQSSRFTEALARYTAAVRHDPSYAEARLRLAGLLRQSGRPDDAMAQYERIMEIDPLMAEAPFGRAMVSVSRGRWLEAADWLADGTAQYPDAAMFRMALARVLAAAPDDRVRDGRRAMELMEGLSDEQRRIDFGETMAMALADVGRFEEAASRQREAITMARDAGIGDLAERMTASLELYETGKPSRTPWREGEVP